MHREPNIQAFLAHLPLFEDRTGRLRDWAG
jgi:hypothetical protein